MEETWELAVVSEDIPITSAGALANLLKYIGKYVNSKSSPTMPVLGSIATDLDSSWDAGDLVLHYMELVNQAHVEITESPALTPQLKVLGRSNVKGASKLLTEMLHGGQFGGHLTKIRERGLVTNLLMVSEMLKANGFTAPYKPEKAKEHADALSAIIRDLKESDLDEHLRFELITSLNRLMRIFIHISDFGFKNADSVSKEIMATLVLKNSLVNASSKDSQSTITQIKQFFSENYTPLKYAIDAGLITTQVGLLMLGN